MAANVSEFESLPADEIRRLGEALKDDKFRKMLMEYAEELSDPDNRKRYEEELALLEKERGVDIVFIHPEGGYVMKTSVVNQDRQKVFVNMCKNKHVGKPSCSRADNGPNGLNWTIPFFMSPPHNDLDKTGAQCVVYDAVFHSDTLYMAQKNARFRKMVEDTALDGIEDKFKVRFERKNIKYPKLKFKGQRIPTVLRKKLDNHHNELDSVIPVLGNKGSCHTLNYEAIPENEPIVETKSIVPKYTIRYRSVMDLEDYAIVDANNPSTRPKELVIDIELPLLNSTQHMHLDFEEQYLILKSTEEVMYDLKIKFPYPVIDKNGNAKFDQNKRRLTVTLPVVPYTEEPHQCRFDFISDNIDYKLPKFTCNQTEDALSLIITTVGTSTDVKFECCDCQSKMSVIYNDGGAWYSICFTTEDVKLWDPSSSSGGTNLILQVRKNKVMKSLSYSTKFHSETLEYKFSNIYDLISNMEELRQQTETFTKDSIALESEQVKVRNVSEESVSVDISIADEKLCKADLIEKLKDLNLSKFRTSSESSEDMNPRGILKHRRNMSESSDDFAWSSLGSNLSPDFETDYGSTDDKPKKSVTFNDCVLRNVFRANSSILGQKKKNQKRTQNKKKMAARKGERRASESEASEASETFESGDGASCSDGESIENNYKSDDLVSEIFEMDLEDDDHKLDENGNDELRTNESDNYDSKIPATDNGSLDFRTFTTKPKRNKPKSNENRAQQNSQEDFQFTNNIMFQLN